MESVISTRETIKFGSIPQQILDEILQYLSRFSAPINVVEPLGESFLGSCTFVQFGGRYFIFTAAHLWEDLKHMSRIGITAQAIASPSIKIHIRDLRPILLGKRASVERNEWGPDLAFLELSDSDTEQLKVYKHFWKLGKCCELKMEPLHQLNDAAWAIVGCPDDRRQGDSQRMTHEMHGSVCPAERLHICSDFDYVDLGMDTTIKDALRDPIGMSGGGLWRVRIIRNNTSDLAWSPESLSLEGVAFWFKRTTPSHRIIRCHGRKSLYGEGLKAIAEHLQQDGRAGVSCDVSGDTAEVFYSLNC